MKHDYQRKIQYLNDIIKQQEEMIEKLQKEKHSSLDSSSLDNSTRRILQTTNDDNPDNCNTGTKNSWSLNLVHKRSAYYKTRDKIVHNRLDFETDFQRIS